MANGGYRSYLGFWVGGLSSQAYIPNSSVDTHDLPIDYDTYKRYRKKLEHVAKLAEKHNQSKYIKQAIKVAEIIEDTQIDAPNIKQAAESVLYGNETKIDFEALAAEISMAMNHFDSVLTKKIKSIEADEDMIVLLMIQ